jgi:transcriptional regulator with XRE-family HTH domain
MDALPFCKVTLRRMRCPHGPYFIQVKGYPANPKTIGEAIRKRRLDLGLRQIDVATLIGCDETTVVHWEKDRANPRLSHIPGIIQFLGHNPLPGGGTIGEGLIAHRKSRGLTQKEFAGQVHVDPSTLAKWERGEREPRGRYADAVNERLHTMARQEVPCCNNRSFIPGRKELTQVFLE